MATQGANSKCLRYLNARRRIHNKTKALAKRIKNLKPETRERVLKACPIKRKRESGGLS